MKQSFAIFISDAFACYRDFSHRYCRVHTSFEQLNIVICLPFVCYKGRQNGFLSEHEPIISNNYVISRARFKAIILRQNAEYSI